MNSTSVSGIYWVLSTPIGELLAYWFQKTIAPGMPRKWKRLLYMASIIAMTSYTDRPDFLLFEKINRLLNLTYRKESYWIPKVFRNMIWRPILQDRIELNEKSVKVTQLDQHPIDRDELEKICDFFMRKTPRWIVYAPEWHIRKDLKICLTQLFGKRYNIEFA